MGGARDSHESIRGYNGRASMGGARDNWESITGYNITSNGHKPGINPECYRMILCKRILM